MKIPNCSTWNKIKTGFFRFAFCAAFSFSLAFSPLRAALAAPAVVPVAAEGIGALLVALGLMTGDAVNGYKWAVDGSFGGYDYTSDIFGNYVPKIKTGETLTSGDLSPLWGTVIPDDVYTTDGERFFVGGDVVAPTDLFLMAESLIGVNYVMPTNIIGSQYTVGATSYDSKFFGISFANSADIDKDIYYFPFVTTASSAYILNVAWSPTSKGWNRYNFDKDTVSFYSGSSYSRRYYWYAIGDPMQTAGFANSDSLETPQGYISYATTPKFNPIVGSNVLTYSADNKFTLLKTQGLPSREVVAEKEKLSGAVVKVGNSDDDDDNNPVTPPTPQPPDYWQIWQTVEELVEQVETDKVTNAGTNLGDYVNNNYIYNKVDVDINVPEEITNNVNMSGGLDFNGKGDININFNEDVSLPTAGDGSGFYNPDAADVVGALGKDNPVVGVVSGLFAAIDPALVGVFSVSVSLLLVLGLWKLIRG